MLYWHDNVYCCIYFFGFDKVFLHDCGDFPAFGKFIQSSFPVTFQDTDAELEPPLPVPYRWSLSVGGQGNVLWGVRTKREEPVIGVNHDDAIYDVNTPTWPKVFMSDDLTKAQAKRAYHARIMKENKAILDTWNTNCFYNDNRKSHQYSA